MTCGQVISFPHKKNGFCMTNTAATDLPELKTFGERMTYARKHCPKWLDRRKRPVLQAEIAETAGVTRSAISQVEADRVRSLSASVVDAICSLTGVDRDWLTNGNESKAPWLQKKNKRETSTSKSSDDIDIENASLIAAIASQILSNAQNGIPVGKLVTVLKGLVDNL